MRRIYKTTTAIVTCMALAAPQFALAQDQQTGDMPDQLILPQGEATEAPAPEQQPAEPAAEPANEPETEAAAEEPAAPEEAPAPEQAEAQPAAEPMAEAPEETPEQPPAAAAQDQAQPEAQPQDAQPMVTEQPAAESAPPVEVQAVPEEPQLQPDAPVAPAAESQPEALAPASKPPVTQAEQPAEKPPVTQAESPAAKPADAAASAERTEKLATEAQKTPQPKPDSAQAVTTTDPAPQAKPASAAATGAPIGADALREKLEAEAAAQNPQPEPAPVAEAQPDTAPAAPAPEPADLQAATAEPPAELPAPEMQAAPNAVAQRAAEQVAPATAAALSAGSDQAPGQMDEVAITQDNTRSSAEDFATSVMQGLQPGAATNEARDNDDKDDSKRDIAKMLLAGAAGFAVGKMLSNDREVALNTGDRVVVTLPDGSQQIIKDDNALLYRPGSNVQTETFQDGSTRTTVLRADGSRVVTIRDADMNTLRRTLIRTDGSETQLIDDTNAEPVRVSTLPAPPPVEVIRRSLDEDALREALRRETAVDRRFSLGQVRDIPEVRALVAPVNVPEVTFDTGSAAITPDQARQLATLGKVIRDSIDQNPREIYMIEGYTDAVGSNAANLALSDRRAESVALALTEYFQVPPENMVVQGYGEQFLLVPTDGAERQNRRVAVRRITQLLAEN